MARKKRTGKDVARYQPTAEETEITEKVIKRAQARPRAPFLTMDVDEDAHTNAVGFDHQDETTAQLLAMNEMGTDDTRFYIGLLKHLAGLGERGKAVSEDTSNFALSVIRAVNPSDEIETMLAAQMAAVHQATMAMASRLNQVNTLPQLDSAERALNKLARTYTAQMDALKRYRAKAQQIVRVERVTVNEGGQAIVGPVQAGGRGSEEK